MNDVAMGGPTQVMCDVYYQPPPSKMGGRHVIIIQLRSPLLPHSSPGPHLLAHTSWPTLQHRPHSHAHHFNNMDELPGLIIAILFIFFIIRWYWKGMCISSLFPPSVGTAQLTHTLLLPFRHPAPSTTSGDDALTGPLRGITPEMVCWAVVLAVYRIITFSPSSFHISTNQKTHPLRQTSTSPRFQPYQLHSHIFHRQISSFHCRKRGAYRRQVRLFWRLAVCRG